MCNPETIRAGSGVRFRKLRIAWSVAWGIACLLIVVLWVRSTAYVDVLTVRATSSRTLSIASIPGVLWITPNGFNPTTNRWHRIVESADLWVRAGDNNVVTRRSLFGIMYRWLKIPYWFLASVTAAISALPFLRWRFSLRTLLIAMTLVAVGLGVIVYSMR
jgi:hypothetical protein